jgi:hypothetical protein
MTVILLPPGSTAAAPWNHTELCLLGEKNNKLSFNESVHNCSHSHGVLSRREDTSVTSDRFRKAAEIKRGSLVHCCIGKWSLLNRPVNNAFDRVCHVKRSITHAGNKREGKQNMKVLPISLVVLSLLGTGAFAQTSIYLGIADYAALLGGAGITNVSAQTYITGDVGSSPTCSVTGLTQSQVRGRLFLNCNPETAEAQKALTAAYNEAAGAPCGTDLSGKDLGGMMLEPGVYCFSSSAGLTGTLTLDAQGNPDSQWIFQVGSSLTTATNSEVAMVLGPSQPPWSRGLRGCNVYWQIGSSATIGSGSTFVGKILALTSITLNGGVLRGKALASNGAVTMSAQETVDGPPCGKPPVAD